MMLYSNPQVLSLFLILMFTYSVHELLALRLQSITLFSDNCCKGRNETFTTSSKNLEEISDIVASGRMKSFSVHRGLWTLNKNKDFTGAGVHQEGNNDEKNGNCGSSATGSGTYTQYKSMRYIGNSMVDLPGLSLFSQNSFMGDELYFDGKELHMSKIFEFKSYGFTGKESWTIISSSNGSINSSCLSSQQLKTVSYVETVSDKTNGTLPVRIIRRGCAKTSPGARLEKQLQVQNGLKLYTNENKLGDELFTDGMELRLPAPIKIESYAFIGNKNWTIFPGTRFNGDFDCLVNVKDTSFVNDKFVVGSIKRGCKGDPVAEVITPPPEVMDKQTDASSAFGLRKTPCHYANVLPGFVFLVSFIVN